MARPKKNADAKIVETPQEQEEAKVNIPENEENAQEQEEATPDIPDAIDELMKLYPQYEQIYVTKDGFVHPFGVPKYLTADATLYKNKYFINE